MSTLPRVVVVGAGIVGASVAYHLARRGAAVTVVDRGQPGEDCTAKSFAWFGSGDPYWPLRRMVLEDYYRLDKELSSRLPIRWCGSLVWDDEPAETERAARAQIANGLNIRLVEKEEIARLEPNLRTPPEVAAFEPSAGAIDPGATTKLLVRAAQEFGAEFRFGADNAALVASGQKATGIEVAGERLEADVVVVAAGVGSRQLLAPLGLTLPVEPSPARIVRFRSPRPLVTRIIASASREVRQLTDGILITPEEHYESDPSTANSLTQASLQRFLNGAENLELESFEIGMRPMPVDGMPIVGPIPEISGLYVAVMHSGVNFAPVVGRLAAVEVLDGVSVKLLDEFRPYRFFWKEGTAS